MLMTPSTDVRIPKTMLIVLSIDNCRATRGREVVVGKGAMRVDFTCGNIYRVSSVWMVGSTSPDFLWDCCCRNRCSSAVVGHARIPIRRSGRLGFN